MESKEDEVSILAMPNLPEDLITETLLRLPVKSLLKFRSVSKSWLSLIRSPEFVKNHLLLSATNKDYKHHSLMFKNGFKDCSLTALLYGSFVEVNHLDYPGKNLKGRPRIVGSVNGLICLAIRFGGGAKTIFAFDLADEKWTKEYGIQQSWTKMFTIKSPPPQDRAGPIIYPPFLMSTEGDILLQFGSHFTRYNTKDASIRYRDVTNFTPCPETSVTPQSFGACHPPGLCVPTWPQHCQLCRQHMLREYAEVEDEAKGHNMRQKESIYVA
ncbi:hypothetical protein BC332_06889 [Capsicum chinense]|nr:hypothetical protein BC332_06889 [Capsicum chinense]